MERIDLLLVLVPAFPLAAAVLTAVLGPKILRSQSHWLVILALLGAFASSVALLRAVDQAQRGAVELGRAGECGI